MGRGWAGVCCFVCLCGLGVLAWFCGLNSLLRWCCYCYFVFLLLKGLLTLLFGKVCRAWLFACRCLAVILVLERGFTVLLVCC